MVDSDFPLPSLSLSLSLSIHVFIAVTTSKCAYTYVSVDVTTVIVLMMTLIMTVASSGHATAFHVASMPDRKSSFVSYYGRLQGMYGYRFYLSICEVAREMYINRIS